MCALTVGALFFVLCSWFFVLGSLFMSIQRFEDIEGWQLARELCKQVYAAIAASPAFSKDWGLKDQITRAAGSVMDNVGTAP